MEVPKEPHHIENPEKESLRSKIVERLVWIKNEYSDSPAVIIAAMIDAGYEFRQDKDLADYMIEDEKVANNVADMLEIDKDKLMSSEYMSREDFLREDKGEGSDG